jgi:hypothetical protein
MLEAKQHRVLELIVFCVIASERNERGDLIRKRDCFSRLNRDRNDIKEW